MSDVWDEHWSGSTKTLDMHVSSLRRKLAEHGRGPRPDRHPARLRLPLRACGRHALTAATAARGRPGSPVLRRPRSPDRPARGLARPGDPAEAGRLAAVGAASGSATPSPAAVRATGSRTAKVGGHGAHQLQAPAVRLDEGAGQRQPDPGAAASGDRRVKTGPGSRRPPRPRPRTSTTTVSVGQPEPSRRPCPHRGSSALSRRTSSTVRSAAAETRDVRQARLHAHVERRFSPSSAIRDQAQAPARQRRRPRRCPLRAGRCRGPGRAGRGRSAPAGPGWSGRPRRLHAGRRPGVIRADSRPSRTAVSGRAQLVAGVRGERALALEHPAQAARRPLQVLAHGVHLGDPGRYGAHGEVALPQRVGRLGQRLQRPGDPACARPAERGHHDQGQRASPAIPAQVR